MVDKKKSFTANVKDCYFKEGLKTNDEVFDHLLLSGIIPEGEEKKFRTKVGAAMWAIRTPEDSLTSSSRGQSAVRVNRLRELLSEGMSNLTAWEVMYKEGEAGAFDPPGRKWVIDTAWRIRKEPAVIEALKKLGLDPKGNKLK